jgi:hypothetical protein
LGAIFLSYAREDRGCANLLARALEHEGHEVWWDRHIDSGEEFAAEIEAELDKADVVLVAWSKQSVKSRWVRDEAAVGGDTGRLVPVSIDGTLAPMGFRQFQTLDLTGWKGAKRDGRTAELLHSVDRRIHAMAGTPTVRGPEPQRLFSWPTRTAVWGIAAGIALIIAAASVTFLVDRGQPSGPAAKPTIGLLPFSAPSSDAALRDVAVQARDSIAHTLSQSGVPVRLLSAASQGRPTVDFLINGDFSRSADKLVANVRLDEASHGVTVFSRRFEAVGDDSRNLPERVGAQIAGDLTWGGVLLDLDKRHPTDPALLAEILKQADFTGDQLQNYQTLLRVAAKAPDWGIAQLGVAFNTAFILGDIPREERAAAVAVARRAADRARALEPEFGDTFAPWCYLHSETQWAECEDRLRAGKRVDPDAPFLNTFLAHLVRGVGRFRESLELTRLSYTHDPYVPTKIAWMLGRLEWAGSRDEAQELYQQGARWWPEYKEMFFRNRMFGILDRGDFEAGRRLEEEVGSEPLPRDYRDSSALITAVRSKSRAAVTRACDGADGLIVVVRCMLAFTTVGDQDRAFALADKLYPARVGRTPAETERIWLDNPDTSPLEFITSSAAAPMRRDPRYLELAQRTGLLAYWRTGRLPDFCGKQPEPICAILSKRS